MKKTLKALMIFVMVAILVACIMPLSAISAEDTRIKVSEIEAESATFTEPSYGATVVRNHNFTVTLGDGVRFANYMSNWQIYDGETWQNYTGEAFIAGTYRYYVQIRIDGDYGTTHTFLIDGIDVSVNGAEWSVRDGINIYSTYSYTHINSPSYVVTETDIPLDFKDSYVFDIGENYKNNAIEEFNFDYAVVGGTKPYTFTKVSGPDWINVSPEGAVSGTPNTPGDNENLVVRVTDGASASKEITISVSKTLIDPADREKISEFVITSNMQDIKVGEQRKTDYSFTFTEGEEAFFSPSMYRWLVKDGENWVVYNGSTFEEGTYRFRAQLRIEDDNGALYMLNDSITVTVDGKPWSVEDSVYVYNTYSYAFVVSPEYTVIAEPVTEIEIEGAPPFTVGDEASTDLSLLTVPADAGYKITGMGWFDYTDSQWVSAGDTFIAGHSYMLAVEIVAKVGYKLPAENEISGKINGEDGEIYKNGDVVSVRLPFGTPVQYTVSFDKNGGEGEMADAIVGGKYTLPECTFTAPEGMVFEKWNVTGMGTKYPADIVIVTEDITLTAEWVHKCSLTPVQAVAPDCATESNGKNAHYVCNHCGKKYEDAEGEELISDFAAWGNVPYQHDYADATCTEPKTCKRTNCGATDGVALGHDYADATCTEPKKCKRTDCDATDGVALGHDYAEATCTEPKTCKRAGCNATDGTANGHTYDNDCDATCNVCQAERTPSPHVWGEGAVTKEPERKTEGVMEYTCSVCNGKRTESIPAKGGIGPGGVVGIVVGSTAVAGVGGFALFWFVIKNKSFGQLVQAVKTVFRKKK